MENLLIITGREELKQILKEALSDLQQTELKNPANKQEASDKPISRNELKEKLGCSLTTIWKYTKNQTIPFFRMGKKMYFNFNDVVQALKNKGCISFNKRGGNHKQSQ